MKQITRTPTATDVRRDDLNIIIVDDEQIACKNLQQLLTQHFDTGLNVLGVANSTADAGPLISKYKPDAVFLDIEMPEENAFRFLERIFPFNFEVVFVTGHDNYAVKAFKLNAIDYVLKPVNVHELKNAIAKLKDKVQYKHIVQRDILHYNKLSDDLNSKGAIHQVILNKKDHIEIVNIKDIIFIEANGSYSDIYFMKNGIVEHILMGYTIAEYEETLPDHLFFRIHRSYLINCGHINKILKEENTFVLVEDKYKLPIGRRRYPDLISFLRRNAFVC